MLSLMCFHEWFAYCTTMYSYIHLVAPHLGTLGAPEEGHEDGAEPKDGV
jgi:hypothetical protein